MSEPVHTIRVSVVGEPETGVWCPACLLPSGFGLLVSLRGGNGHVTATYVARCLDCGGRIATP